MARGTTVTEPPNAAEIADKCHQIRALIGIADQQLDRAKTDLGVARIGLADLEQTLLTLGVAK
jgi:hypothetical protein